MLRAWKKAAEHRENLPLTPMPPAPRAWNRTWDGNSPEWPQPLLWSHWGSRELSPSLERLLCLGGGVWPPIGTVEVGSPQGLLGIELAGLRTYSQTDLFSYSTQTSS